MGFLIRQDNGPRARQQDRRKQKKNNTQEGKETPLLTAPYAG